MGAGWSAPGPMHHFDAADPSGDLNHAFAVSMP